MLAFMYAGIYVFIVFCKKSNLNHSPCFQALQNCFLCSYICCPLNSFLSVAYNTECDNYMVFLIPWCRAVRIAPFSNRLAQAVPSNVQGLRCLANYEALRFSEPIRTLAEKMVDRMVKNSSQSAGKYASVHLRFEEVLFLSLHSFRTYDF